MDGAGRKKIRFSVRLKIILLMFLFIALMLGFLNTYPLIASRDLVFTSKQGPMLSRTSAMAASLSAMEVLIPEGVQQVVRLLNTAGLDRVVIADAKGTVLYDMGGEPDEDGTEAEAELQRALGGEVVFVSRFSGGAFSTSAAQPIHSRGATIGAVYVHEYDDERGQLLLHLQSTLRNISAIVGTLSLLLLIAFSGALTRRMRDLVRAIRTVRDGSYDYRLQTKGHDEITALGDEFNNMTAKLDETDRLRRRFVSDASHELKTPLASIRLLSDSIAQSENMDPETMREFVTDIGTEAERLQRTTEKLLRLTKLDAAPPDRPCEPVDVTDVARDTLRLLLPLAEKQQVTLHPALGTDCVMRGSADELYQIIFNLVENAIKYNTPGGEVYLSVSRTDGEIRVVVEDTGIGIPEEDLPHIFTRFYRVDKARSRASGGSGLGLSIVWDAVRLNGGTVTAQRREGGGSCFTVCFPASNSNEER